jgi:hypothetical protein
MINTMINTFKNLIRQIMHICRNRENQITLMVLVVLLQPIFDLDYLIYPFLNRLGIPLPSTFFYFIVLPLTILFVFFFIEKKKKTVFILASSYLALVMVYTLVHHQVVKDMFELLYLTNRYIYTFREEVRYVITLIIPLGLVYAYYRTELSSKVIIKIAVIASILIAWPIFLSNVFVYGPATYYDGPVQANFLTWFFGAYEIYHPKFLTTQFFFSEGNTTGIVLFALLPILTYAFFRSKRKFFFTILLFVHGWAMFVLATRVSTYGVILMLGATIIVWLILSIMRIETFEWKSLVIVSLLLLMFVSALPYTPAIRNIDIDNRNDLAVFDNENLREQFRSELDSGDLIPGTAEFNYFYENIFRNYYWFLTLPDVYYKWYYPYQIDPKFYVDLIFEVDFWDRKSGRQFQQIFFDYKWDKLNDQQKLFGFGYSRFMMGSILLEQDFAMQKYTLGYIGTIILTFPWLMMILGMVWMVLRKFKRICNFELAVLAMAIVALIGGAYLSGHVLDQFFSSSFLALFMGTLFVRLREL